MEGKALIGGLSSESIGGGFEIATYTGSSTFRHEATNSWTFTGARWFNLGN
jgi:hypothetical protein